MCNKAGKGGEGQLRPSRGAKIAAPAQAISYSPPGCESLVHRASWICTSMFVGADLSIPTAQSGPYLQKIKGHLLNSEKTSSLLLTSHGYKMGQITPLCHCWSGLGCQ